MPRRRAAPQPISGDAPVRVRRNAIAPDRPPFGAMAGSDQANQVASNADRLKRRIPVLGFDPQQSPPGADAQRTLRRAPPDRPPQGERRRPARPGDPTPP